MGELNVHIQVLKNSPILFTWLNEENDSVEGCLVTCPCQKFGLTEMSGQSKSAKKSASFDQKLVGRALQKAIILSIPEGVKSKSVLFPVRKIRSDDAITCGNKRRSTKNQTCPEGNNTVLITTCNDVRGSTIDQPVNTLSIRLIDDSTGNKLDGFKDNDEEGRSTGYVNTQPDKNFAGLLTKKDSIETEMVSKETIDGSTLTRVAIPPTVDKVSAWMTENGNIGVKSYSAKEIETVNMRKEDVNDLIDESDNDSNLKVVEKSFGTSVDSKFEEENELNATGSASKTIGRNDQSYQGGHAQSSRNIQEISQKDTGDPSSYIIINDSITQCTGVSDKIVQIEIDSRLANPSHVEKDYRESMSDIERTLYAALKSFIEPCSTDMKQNSDDINTPSVICPSYQVEANPSTESCEPKVDSFAEGNMSTAMLRYRQYENEKFLQKLHKLDQQKIVHAVICEVCGALLTNKRLKNHMAAFHSLEERERKFECSSCHKKFLKAANLERHKLSHTDYMSKCRFCMKSFKYDYYRKAHEKYHLANPPPVPVRKPRQQKVKLQKDLPSTRKGLPLANSSAAVSGRSVEGKSVGESSETLKIFTCEICGKSVRLVSKYQHLKTHKERKYPCTICDFRLGTKAALKMHMKKHTNECNIPCRICGKLFKRYQDRLNHERIHTGEKPFICKICNKRWRDRATYQGHMKKHHPGMPLMYLRPPIQTPLATVTSAEGAHISKEAEVTKMA